MNPRVRTWIGRIMAGAAAAATLLSPAARSYAAPTVASASELSLSAYARPGRLVTLPSGLRLNIRCAGQGSPTVILTAGAGDQSLTWRAIQDTLSRTDRVCAWDRPGFGFSDPSTKAQDVIHLTNSLEAALAAAMIRPPYVLVGHSLGSFETLMFAFRHPHDVAGIVLIDPAGPFQDERMKRAAPATYAVIDAFQTGQIEHLKRCIGELEKKQPTPDAARVSDDCVMTPEKEYPSELNRALIRIDGNVAAKKDLLSLLNNIASGADSRELQQAWHPLGATPLIVLTAGEPPPIPLTDAAKAQMPALHAEWSRMHDEMARLSTQASNRLVPGATHYIHQDRPQVVVDAINEVIGAARTRESSPERVAPLLSPRTSAAKPKAPSTQSVDVGGYALHFRMSPGCAPTVLLEAGGEMDSSEWSALQPQINADSGSAVVSYDRPGYGDSSLPERSLTLNDEVDALHRALQHLGISGPMILVGHSYGAFLVQIYAHRYPDQISGVVLIDPNTVAFMDAIGGPAKLDLSIPSGTAPKLARAASREIASLEEAIEEARAAPLPKSLPVIVIAAEKRWGPTAQFNEAFDAARKSLVAGLPLGSLVVAHGSGHVIPADRPEVVLAAVTGMIRNLRNTRKQSCR